MFDDLLSQMQDVLKDAKQLKGPEKPLSPETLLLNGPFTDCTKTSGMS